jgi:7 transmembrane receptor (rhodopsin family)
MVVGVIGLMANSFVLYVLSYYNHIKKNATNKFIFNQSLIDVVCCLALVSYVLVKWTGVSNGVGSGASGWIRCLLIDSSAPVVASANASQIGLVIITVERYAMIVHPVGHRKHFRSWMIHVGLVIPWVGGLCLIIIPNWSTTRVVAGQCLSLKFWPTTVMLTAYTVVLFALQFVIIFAILVFCYARIINTIRRQTLSKCQADAAVTIRKPTTSATATAHSESTNGNCADFRNSLTKTLCDVMARWAC